MEFFSELTRNGLTVSSDQGSEERQFWPVLVLFLSQNLKRLDCESLISSILANLAMKPHLNRIALLRSHISMVFILFVSLIAGISINLSILVELFEDEIGLIQV